LPKLDLEGLTSSEEKISDFEFKPPESRSRLVENNEKTSV